MTNFLSVNISITTMLLVLVGLLVFIIILLFLIMRSNLKVKKLTFPVYDYIVKEAQDKAKKITTDAVAGSREIIKSAELEGIKVVEQDKAEAKKMEEEYEKKLTELANQTQELLKKYSTEAEKSFTALTSSLEKKVAESIQKNDMFMQTETDKLSKQLSSTFSTLEANVKEQVRGSVEQEFITVKKIIEAYRQKRFALVDSQIVSLIEGTAKVALQKKLTLSEHSELIYKALEEAKSQGTFS